MIHGGGSRTDIKFTVAHMTVKILLSIQEKIHSTKFSRGIAAKSDFLPIIAESLAQDAILHRARLKCWDRVLGKGRHLENSYGCKERDDEHFWIF